MQPATRRTLRAARHARAGRNRGRTLEVWSKLDSGTEVELSIPGAIAYELPVQRSWFSKLLPGKSRSERTRAMSDYDPKQIRILTVDDHPILRQGIAALIADEVRHDLRGRSRQTAAKRFNSFARTVPT